MAPGLSGILRGGLSLHLVRLPRWGALVLLKWIFPVLELWQPGSVVGQLVCAVSHPPSAHAVSSGATEQLVDVHGSMLSSKTTG